MGKTKADIIVCSRNNRDIICRCLDSIKQQTTKNYTCILVDDCSTDGTAQFVEEKYPWVRVIRKERPTGPSASRNSAIRATQSEFIATVDSDAQLDRNWLGEQLALMKSDSRIGIAASKILYSWDKKRINSCGGSMTKLGFGFDRLSGSSDRALKIQRVLYGHSAAMMVRRRMLDDIGLFDETYFYGNEDTDLGWRANIAGWEVVFNPRATAYHDENATIKNMSWHAAFHGTKNRTRSMIKNYSVSSLAKYLPMHLLLVAGKTTTSDKKSARLSAMLWNFAHIFSTLHERQKVQGTRKISDSDLMRCVFSARLPKRKHAS